MAKHLYCARCGKELAFKEKGIPSLGKTATVVEPHECEEGIEYDFLAAPQKAASVNLEHEPFVRKLDEATQKTKLAQPIKDRRPNRQEVSSIAPQSVRGMIDTMVGRTPTANGGQEYDDEAGDIEDTEDSQIEG